MYAFSFGLQTRCDMAHLTTLDIEPGNQDSVAKSFAALKNELIERKAAWEKAQADVETLA
jgi:hypothetical protein